MSRTRQSSKRAILSRMISSDNPCRLPLEPNKSISVKTFEKSARMNIKVLQKRTETPTPQSEHGYVLMRNGVPFLYTPLVISDYRPDIISPFATQLKGFKIKPRQAHGNMFAIHGSLTERIQPCMRRSYLNTRSKWK